MGLLVSDGQGQGAVMAADGYRVELGCLLAGERGMQDLSDQLRASIGEPLTGSNQGFESVPAALAAAEAWETEVGDLAAVLQTAGDTLAQTAAEYDRADAAGADDFRRILRGG